MQNYTEQYKRISEFEHAYQQFNFCPCCKTAKRTDVFDTTE